LPPPRDDGEDDDFGEEEEDKFQRAKIGDKHLPPEEKCRRLSDRRDRPRWQCDVRGTGNKVVARSLARLRSLLLRLLPSLSPSPSPSPSPTDVQRRQMMLGARSAS